MAAFQRLRKEDLMAWRCINVIIISISLLLFNYYCDEYDSSQKPITYYHYQP